MSMRTYKTTHSNVYAPQGGAKLQGLTSTMGKSHWANRAIRISSVGTAEDRKKTFCINMLGGVGAGRSMFSNKSGYAHPRGMRCS